MFPDLTRDDVFRLETRRLWLRWPRQADVADITRQAGVKAVAEMTSSIPHPYTSEHGRAFVMEARRRNMEGERLTLVVTPRARPGQVIGTVSIFPSRQEGGAELGFWIGADHWGNGFATEAARALIDAFFAYSGGTELSASARVINPDSRRVLEKCGFGQTGSGLQVFPARGGLLPVDHFRLDRRKWESFKAWGPTGYVAGQGETPIQAAALH
jgi:RimJ/RimL family protein N-acetyltransferase